MSLPLNPMNINGPSWSGNYVQPNIGNPTVSANVASYPTGSNVLNLSWPLPVYAQPNFAPKPNHAALPLGDGNG